MAFHSSTIANFFISKDPSIKGDMMKVLKLVYIAHGFHLASTNEPLIDETVMAWQYGPVIPELYFQLKTDKLQYYPEEWASIEANPNMKDFLNVIWDKYKKYTGFQLSDLSHKKDTPWDITVRAFEGIIPNDRIKTHYIDLMTR